MRLFFDSSAFAKRYIQESGSDLAIEWCERADELALAAIAIPEMISAFCRLRREEKISEHQYRQTKSVLLLDIEDIAVCDLTPQVIRFAVDALESNALRGMDAIHVGCALAWRADLFLTSDRRQWEAARSAGLSVEIL
jgi:predicted nucleic acid-binding protein